MLPLVAVVASALAVARVADAAPTVCQRTIAAKLAKYVNARMRVLEECHEQVITGRRAGPCPDQRTSQHIAKLESQLAKGIALGCGGEDKRCGTSDDEGLGDIGWGGGECPGFLGACAESVESCGDVASCLACVGGAAVEHAMALTFGHFVESAGLLERCQATIGRSLARFFVAKQQALAVCEDRVLRGVIDGPCPDVVRTAPRIERALAKVHQRICRACGGWDQVCGAPDEFRAFEIGFPSQCPDVTPVGAPSCAGPTAR